MRRKNISSVLCLLLIAGCTFPDYSPDTWNIAGDVLFQGTPSTAVKFAAFYTYEYTFDDTSQGSVIYPSAILVSNVFNLGTAGGSFSLDVDASSLTPADGQYIYLIMWLDANRNDQYDVGEQWSYAIPRYGDPTFQHSLECMYYYADDSDSFMGTEDGWNQSIGFVDFQDIYDATKTGAKLSNESSWY